MTTVPEAMLWRQLRGGKADVKFRRQHPSGPHVANFYGANAALAVEDDGVGHSPGDRPFADARRDEFLNENGYRVLRVAAVDILRDIDRVVRLIVSHLAAPLHHAAHGPPPRAGEE